MPHGDTMTWQRVQTTPISAMARQRSSTADYQQKRDFRHTPEPSGSNEGKPEPSRAERRTSERARSNSSGRRPAFVVQQHSATSMHYDFRLEAGGVLKSWAIPKGPSTNPADKVLAMPTEDHPLDYAGFEGVIPEGNYGAGPVIIWDAGTYRNLGDVPVEEAIEGGHVSVWLEGQKLTGGYALTRIRKKKSEAWLLVKMKDERADARRHPTSTQPESVRSGRTVQEVGAGGGGGPRAGRQGEGKKGGQAQGRRRPPGGQAGKGRRGSTSSSRQGS
jgi:DNA ligase D-like protein (predicted 3'-phosphoesterase)